ncbi:NfeD family protein [Alloalcanivorax mobilis]|uniref:NfeD family protein n=1 Tax=Alloalcanivorax mobilis TaxID=2019569 RepID=UPI000C76A227|nr:NfeD family protein [Alloalcanivorax mobilis]|tara:strand:- start:1165 stop:1620 length:456 start_codon:yes stop_codon:yes gene_type:complete
MPEYSYWIILGLALIILEFVLSGLVTVFLGIAALLVGVLVFLGLLDDTAWELALFSLFSLLLLAVARRYFRRWLLGKETRAYDSGDSAGLVGHRATVAGPFHQGSGTVLYRGARWQAQASGPLEDGQMVRIIEHQGLWLTVEPWTPPASKD